MHLALQLLAGLLLSIAIAWTAYRRGSLSRGGAAGALLMGTSIFGFGGVPWGMVLILFFITSSRLSHYKEAVKARVAEEKFSKGNKRDLGQVLANGGGGALFAAASMFAPRPVMLAAFLGAMGTVNADTWATELGVLSRRLPRSVLTWRVAETGTSGAISPFGTFAATLGALVIGLGAWAFGAIERALGGSSMPGLGFWVVAVALIGGVVGSLLDSVLGATVQAIFRCPRCDKETEKTVHNCGSPTVPLRGLSWLGNDWVNFLSSLGGALIAVGCRQVFF